MRIEMNLTAWDPDGDALVSLLMHDGNTWSREHIPAYDPERTAPGGPGYAAFTIVTVGTHVETLSVSDGKVTVNSSVTVRATGSMNLFEVDVKVTESCSLCSGGLPPLHLGTPLGAKGCKGFLMNESPEDCAWSVLSPEWENHQFFANATDDASADLEFRSDCSPTGEAIGLHAHDGAEIGPIPEGAGCVVLWTYYGPATIHFEVQRTTYGTGQESHNALPAEGLNLGSSNNGLGS